MDVSLWFDVEVHGILWSCLGTALGPADQPALYCYSNGHLTRLCGCLCVISRHTEVSCLLFMLMWFYYSDVWGLCQGWKLEPCGCISVGELFGIKNSLMRCTQSSLQGLTTLITAFLPSKLIRSPFPANCPLIRYHQSSPSNMKILDKRSWWVYNRL